MVLESLYSKEHSGPYTTTPLPPLATTQPLQHLFTLSYHLPVSYTHLTLPTKRIV